MAEHKATTAKLLFFREITSEIERPSLKLNVYICVNIIVSKIFQWNILSRVFSLAFDFVVMEISLTFLFFS